MIKPKGIYEASANCIAGRPKSDLSATDEQLLAKTPGGTQLSRRLLNEYWKTHTLRYWTQGDVACAKSKPFV